MPHKDIKDYDLEDFTRESTARTEISYRNEKIMNLENIDAIKKINKERKELIEKDLESLKTIIKIRAILVLQNKEAKERVKKSEMEISQIDFELRVFMDAYELKDMKILNMEMKIVSKDLPRIYDIKKYLEWIKKNDAYDCLNKNILKISEINKILEKDKEVDVPGVELFSMDRLKVSTLK